MMQLSMSLGDEALCPGTAGRVNLVIYIRSLQGNSVVYASVPLLRS